MISYSNCLHLSIYLSINLFLYFQSVPIYLSIYLSQSDHLSISNLSIYLVYVHIYLSIYLSLFICLSIYLSLFICLSIYLSLFICLSIYLSLFICLSIYLSLFICLSIYLSLFICLSIYLSLFICLSIYLSLFICLSIYLSLIIYQFPVCPNLCSHLFLSLSLSLYIYIVYLPIYLSIYLSTKVHIYQYIYLHVYPLNEGWYTVKERNQAYLLPVYPNRSIACSSINITKIWPTSITMVYSVGCKVTRFAAVILAYVPSVQEVSFRAGFKLSRGAWSSQPRNILSQLTKRIQLAGFRPAYDAEWFQSCTILSQLKALPSEDWNHQKEPYYYSLVPYLAN